GGVSARVQLLREPGTRAQAAALQLSQTARDDRARARGTAGRISSGGPALNRVVAARQLSSSPSRGSGSGLGELRPQLSLIGRPGLLHRNPRSCAFSLGSTSGTTAPTDRTARDARCSGGAQRQG